jgi:hypothetical protein
MQTVMSMWTIVSAVNNRKEVDINDESITF